MSDVNIFEQAVKQKLRFHTPKGVITTEDLYDLPLRGRHTVNLDALALAQYKKVQSSEPFSFVSKETETDPEEKLRFEVLKQVIMDKMQAEQKAIRAKKQADKKQLILSIMARKENEALEGSSLDELKEMLKDL